MFSFLVVISNFLIMIIYIWVGLELLKSLLVFIHDILNYSNVDWCLLVAFLFDPLLGHCLALTDFGN